MMYYNTGIPNNYHNNYISQYPMNNQVMAMPNAGYANNSNQTNDSYLPVLLGALMGVLFAEPREPKQETSSQTENRDSNTETKTRREKRIERREQRRADRAKRKEARKNKGVSSSPLPVTNSTVNSRSPNSVVTPDVNNTQKKPENQATKSKKTEDQSVKTDKSEAETVQKEIETKVQKHNGKVPKRQGFFRRLFGGNRKERKELRNNSPVEQEKDKVENANVAGARADKVKAANVEQTSTPKVQATKKKQATVTETKKKETGENNNASKNVAGKGKTTNQAPPAKQTNMLGSLEDVQKGIDVLNLKGQAVKNKDLKKIAKFYPDLKQLYLPVNSGLNNLSKLKELDNLNTLYLFGDNFEILNSLPEKLPNKLAFLSLTDLKVPTELMNDFLTIMKELFAKNPNLTTIEYSDLPNGGKITQMKRS